MAIWKRMAAAGIELPPVVAPLASYLPARRSGDLIWTSGQLPLLDGELLVRGTLGEEVSVADGVRAARVAGLNAVAAAAQEAGGVDSILRVLRVVVYVASHPDFTEQPTVANGASELMAEIFGHENGAHVRSAVGVSVLPLDAPVEVELVVEVQLSHGNASQAAEVNARLGAQYPNARCELDFTTPFELLVATVLSAQSTDRRVNSVTRSLFALYPDAVSLSSADREEVERIIAPVGFFRNKATSVIGLSRRIVDDFDGRVPATLEELVTLPGVGRKTANVVLGDAFGVPGITPDTHLIRLANRLGWVDSTKPDVVERDVGALFDPCDWVVLNHRIIWHGRRCCHARRPACGACVLADLCPAFGEGETDPVKARTLLREPRA